MFQKFFYHIVTNATNTKFQLSFPIVVTSNLWEQQKKIISNIFLIDIFNSLIKHIKSNGENRKGEYDFYFLGYGEIYKLQIQ